MTTVAAPVVTASIKPSFAGNLLANAAAVATSPSVASQVGCSLYDGSKLISAGFVQSIPPGGVATVSPAGGEKLSAGQTANVSVKCSVNGGTANVQANLNLIAAPPG